MAKQVLYTKLHPPTLPHQWIERAGPAKRLEEGELRPLTLVSAPAGYGKSTCVAAWLETRDAPSAWLSLERGESEAGAFLTYLLAALRTMFEGACPETKMLLEAPEQPPVPVLAHSLANELSAIETPFTLALDDYQNIDDPGVHDLLSHLLAHPPRCLHLILIARRDPPLSLTALRARGRLSEVSVQDLQFDRLESARFLEQDAGVTLSEKALDNLQKVIEGWPVGLRLVSLALRTRRDPEAFLCDLRGATPEVQEYLVQEVLDALPAAQREWLLGSSITDRFCASLCEAVCPPKGDARGAGLDGRAFVESLEANGLFAIPLDEREEWYRFHHTFQQLLRARLERQSNPDQIAALHSRAARWLEENDLPDEAIHHALTAGDPKRAGAVVRRFRKELVNEQQWTRLDHWLARLPASIADEDPALLVARAWSCEYRYRSCVDEHLQKAEERLAANPPPALEREAIQGEIDALRSLSEYNAGHTQKALTLAERALVELPPDAHGLRGYALDVVVLAHQSMGDLQGGLDSLLAALEDHSADVAFRLILLTGLAYAYWQEGDLVGMRRSALQNLRLVEEQGLRTSIAYARFHLGVHHYSRDELAEAEQNLQAVIDLRFFAAQDEYCHAAFVLALALLGQGRSEEAREVVESVSEHALEIGNPRLVELVRTFEAEFELRLGRPEQALRWAKTYSPTSFKEFYQLYIPQLTLAKVLLAEAAPESGQAAAGLVNGLLDTPQAAHHVPVRIQGLSLLALAHAADGKEAAALEKLIKALELAAPGGFIRPFVDLGAPMLSLLGRLSEEVAGTEHVGRILAACGAKPPAREARPLTSAVLSDGAGALVEPLSRREQDVLELLTERLRDKEIAEKLFVSPATVKSNLRCLYRKLDVGDRREAVVRARELGILADV